jgi:hypothetical protein
MEGTEEATHEQNKGITEDGFTNPGVRMDFLLVRNSKSNVLINAA